MKEAPEPSSVIWENLECTPKKMFIEQTLTMIVTLGLVFVSFIIVYSIKSKTFGEADDGDDDMTIQARNERLAASVQAAA